MAKRRKAARKKTAAKKRRPARRAAKRTAKKRPARKAARRTAKKRPARKAAKRPARRAKAKKPRAKRAPNPAFMKPMQPDSMLAAVVGSNPIPRTEVTKRVWDYIKRRGLQDPTERRMINADDNLRPVFGGRSRVSMFEMTKLVNDHLR